jgi:hypothetical protein
VHVSTSRALLHEHLTPPHSKGDASTARGSERPAFLVARYATSTGF